MSTGELGTETESSNVGSFNIHFESWDILGTGSFSLFCFFPSCQLKVSRHLSAIHTLLLSAGCWTLGKIIDANAERLKVPGQGLLWIK